MLDGVLKINSCGYLERAPEHFHQRDRPMDNLVIWVVAGLGFGKEQHRSATAGAGDLLTFTQHRRHEYRSSAEAPWAILWAHFVGDGASRVVRRIGRHGSPLTTPGLDEALQARWFEMIAAFQRGGLDREVVAASALYAILGMLVYRLESHPTGMEAAPALPAEQLQRYIEQHLDRPLSLRELAEVTGLSETHLGRLFRARFRTSPMRYVRQQRVARAATLLEQSGAATHAIARAVGFDDPYHFSRVFRQITGFSPSAYRARRDK